MASYQKTLTRDRILNLRVSMEEEVKLRRAAKVQEKSISQLIREGYLK